MRGKKVKKSGKKTSKKKGSWKVSIAEVIVSSREGVLLLKRSRNNSLYIGKWQLPGGKVEKGESPLNAAKREVLEEIGCKCFNIKLVKKLVFSNYYKGHDSQVELHVFSCKLNGNVCLGRDHSEAKFVKKSDINPSTLAPVSRWALFEE